MTTLDGLGRALQAYCLFGASAPNVDPHILIDFVRSGLSGISGQTSRKDPIIGGIRLIGELKIKEAKDTLQIALNDNNTSVRNEAKEALKLIA